LIGLFSVRENLIALRITAISQLMRAEPNTYSRQWFEFFHVGIGEARTMQETAFVCHCAPLPHFCRVLDVCCGMGRHARALSSRGYSVIDIERDADVIAKARALAGGPSYLNADVRDYRPEQGAFDVAIIMSQSFGYFDAITNRDVLGRLAAGVREGGRVILDLWSPEFFAAHQGERDLKQPCGVVRETKHVEHERLFVHLDYPDGSQEQFEWQLFSPMQRSVMAESVGLTQVVACTDFEETTPPSPTNPRIQFLFERRAASPTYISHS
jgi:SAM-dependent methyltransferase